MNPGQVSYDFMKLSQYMEEAGFPADGDAMMTLKSVQSEIASISELVSAGEQLGGWLAAAIDDPLVCVEMKKDADRLLHALDPFLGGLLAVGSMRVCLWKQDEDGSFDTTCGNKHVFLEGDPDDNGHKFCPYCGSHLELFAPSNAIGWPP